MATLREKYLQEVELTKQDASQIATASEYTENYLMHGTSCDSSNRSGIRMRYIKRAESLILTKYKKEIIELASKLCLAEIGE
jgi:hypothetical protein